MHTIQKKIEYLVVTSAGQALADRSPLVAKLSLQIEELQVLLSAPGATGKVGTELSATVRQASQI
jgi:hypothetical protein